MPFIYTEWFFLTLPTCLLSKAHSPLKLVHFHFCPPSAHTYIHYMRIPQAGRM
ncbi:hypothetical protein HanXRQr2_Chr07g0308281 [Helianthus annuus]|uniref:Uncharacterized protein n=1 Tax=Helianthus annuus TaxID=4232 RepID=A0A9K3INX2_HELAN|nr:hypothetical protein HanXRQr2_Chr07g0308281 [Helianthus annuus]